MTQRQRAIIELNIAVMLFGLTAILGALITLNAVEIVWWRLLFTCGSILFIFPVIKTIKLLDRKSLKIYCGIGVVVTLHWITFYGSIKLSNASTALICLATTSCATAVIEPLLLKRKVDFFELFLGVLIIPGMLLVVQSSPAHYLYGIIVGLISAILAATFSILNKKYISDAAPLMITFIELGAGLICITIMLLIYSLAQGAIEMTWPTPMDFLWLVILALACTTLAYVLTLRSLKYLSAFATNLTINLEPVYGILLAYFLLNDRAELQPGFYLGSLIIISTLIVYFLFKRRLKLKSK